MRKLAWFAGGFAAACLLSCLSFGGAGAAAVCALFALAMALPLRRLPKRLFELFRRGAVLCLGGALAFLWCVGYSALFRAPAEALAGTAPTLTGEVTSYPESNAIGGYSLMFRPDGGLRSPDIQLNVSPDWGGLTPGDRVSCTPRLVCADKLFGEETFYYTARGVYLLGYCHEPPHLLSRGGDPLRYLPQRCARALKRGIDAAFDSQSAPLAAAVCLGDTDALSEGAYSDLSRAGLLHTTAVSGMHISFLSALGLFLCRGRRKAAVALIPLLLFYALMTGASPSAVRAVIMQCALLSAPLARREADPPTSLGLAALILLLLNPFSAAGTGLQLSFCAVAGILLCSARLSRAMIRPVSFRLRNSGRMGRILLALYRFAAVNIAVTLGAMVFTLPLSCLRFGRISLCAPLSVLLTQWAVTALMVGALFVGGLAALLPGAMVIPGQVFGLLARYILWVSRVVSAWRFSGITADNLYFRLWLAAVYLLLAAALLGRSLRRGLAVIPCAAALLALCVALNARSVGRSDLTVTALDVGQGAAALFFSGGDAVLVDCGGNVSLNAGDLAADHLASMGKKRLDALIFTHLDADHCNGASQLFRRLEVGAVYYPAQWESSEHFPTLRSLAARAGTPLIPISGEILSLPAGKARFTLYPALSADLSNEAGLFVLCELGQFRVLATGDADADTEHLQLKYHPLPDIDLLLVGHHGASRSTGGELLDALRPELAVISVGYNAYGHPSGETLLRLQQSGCAVYRTDLAGNVTVSVKDGLVRTP
ncbi:MAG: ComEC/Rec2 family competence protein [Oscillospiraceae bacterium]|nr:ComEC/Rec2 family competence protein [Oscillospiraceae bacterium]